MSTDRIFTHDDAQSLITAVLTLAGNTEHIGDLSELKTDAKTDLVSAINEIAENVIADGAGAHNGISRGKYLGDHVTADQYAAIASGTFHGMLIHDHWIINGVTWRIMHFDYWLDYGDTACATHHVVVVPDTPIATAQMNSTNVTTGAYVGSDFYTGNNSNTGKSSMKTAINNAFGSAHVLVHREYLKNAVTSGYESGGAWYDSTAELMTEEMVFGTVEFKNITNGTTWPYGYTIDHGQLAGFALNHALICNRSYCWLRDVAASTYFALVGNTGNADANDASYVIGIRPVFGICA